MESGTNEDGTEWEKRQITAPRTFEEAITDQNKVPLSKKIADILDKINQLNGGEYDTLLAEIEIIKKEIDELDLTQWDYQVPNAVGLLFRGTSETKDVALNMYASDNFALQNAATGNDLVQLLSERDRLNFLLETTFARTVTVTSNQEIIFGSDDKESKFRVFAAANGYRFQIKPANGAWDTKIYIDKDRIYTYLPVDFAFPLSVSQGIKVQSDTGIEMGMSNNYRFRIIESINQFYLQHSGDNDFSHYYNIMIARNDGASFYKPVTVFGDLTLDHTTDTEFKSGGVIFKPNYTGSTKAHRIVQGDDNNLYFCSGSYDTIFPHNAYVTPEGKWIFLKNISAPNIVSRSSVAAAEQGITEQDLQMIDVQQTITEHELDYIVTQQALTEMDLERLEGENNHG